MNGEYLSKNATFVWLHPKRVLSDLEDFEFMQENLEKALDENARLLQEAKLIISRLKDENMALSKKLEEYAMENRDDNAAKEKIITSLRQKLEALRTELREQKEIEEQMVLFDRKLSSFEEMKARYEAKIEQLKSELAAKINPIQGWKMEETSPDNWLLDLPE